MNYIITDEGLRVLKEEKIASIIDCKFEDLNRLFLSHWFKEEIERYVSENRVHPEYKEKVFAGESEKIDDFIVFSYIVANSLIESGDIPVGLPDTLMTAIGAYFLTKQASDNRYRRNFAFRNNRSLTCINGDVHGDFFIQQYNHVPEQKKRTLIVARRRFD